MIQSVINPKQPHPDSAWVYQHGWKAPKQLSDLGYPVTAWFHAQTGLFVLSAVEVAHDPGTPDLGPEYHLSISAAGNKRCSHADALWVLAQFDLLDALEDNHVPGGFLRNFWRPVADHLSGYECACVATEPAMVEDKGDFVWRGITK